MDEERTDRMTKIRRQSESYGARFCSQNAHLLGPAVALWLRKDPTLADKIEVRAYNRADNTMYTTPLTGVLDAVAYGADGAPARLSVTPFGQVVLTPTVYLSAAVYAAVVAVWHALERA